MVESKKKQFEYQKKIALVVGISDYDNLKEIKDEEEKKKYENYGNLPPTEEDMVVVRAGLLRLGFKDEEIIPLQGPTNREFLNKCIEIRNMVDTNFANEPNKNTLVFIYYAGHGVSDNYTFAILNEANPGKQ